MDDDFRIEGGELTIEAPSNLTENERDVWLDGFYSALAITHEAVDSIAEAAVPEDHDLPDGPIEIDENATGPTPPCPQCGTPTREGMGGRYTCTDCSVTLTLDVESHDTAQ